ncbi:putative transmembrane protein [Toxoplasma gondii GAB2-2007-GAL-DOM2]|uniref:Transmembrane protein n=6 Tax=Toxoplasma gondii TaxID=5811 RepID=S7V2W8_TOXGG|nr:hypothetical protein TGGT1_230510 [Toxoplasma gondii GT1]KAF4641678.1 hypothetical protein TGRH88_074880 [Toxoplasma gondii]KFG48301.1 putative transmembrane protein [Toxoplasma gondii GAB2-2007-GAL-DOM2]KFG55473.1 putative transmembrane protein [Toxoplasma gondii FOU]PUA92807.1 putative transmembrane protein [Toxoplasma gondii TgCATBr9]RQX74839.1 putative transmembrane protein [Toxoplasma gondii CAST]
MVSAPFSLRGHAAHDCVRFFFLWATLGVYVFLCCSASSALVYDVKLSVLSGLGAGTQLEGKPLGRLAIREYSRPAESPALNAKSHFSGSASAPAFAEGPTRAVRANWISFSGSVLSSALEAATREQQSGGTETLPWSMYPLLSLRLEPVVTQEEKNQQNRLIPALEVSAPVSFLVNADRPGSPSAVCRTETPFLLSLHVSPSLVPFSASIRRLPESTSDQVSATSEHARSVDRGSDEKAVSDRIVLTCPEVTPTAAGQNRELSTGRAPALQVILPPAKAGKEALIVPVYFPGESQHRAGAAGAPIQGGQGEKEDEQPSFWRRNWWLILCVLVMASLMGGDSGGAAPQNGQGAPATASSNPSQRPREGVDRRR